MFEYYENTLCVEGGWLYGDGGILSLNNYRNLVRRERVRIIRKGGGYGRSALIAFESIPPRFKKLIIEKFGDPEKTLKNQKFADTIVYDEAAKTFFKTFEKSNGDPLSPKQIEQYIERANIFNAIKVLITEREKKRGAFGKSNTTLWKNIATTVSQLDTANIHKLPKHHRRLQEPYNRYIENGYFGLLHKGLENDRTKKIKGDIADWWLAMYSLPNKMMVPVIMAQYDDLRNEKDWPSLSEQAINNWLHTPEVERLWTLARHGKEEYDKKYKHTIKRSKTNWFPNCYWAIDGSKIDWIHYEDNVLGMAAQLKIDPVVDVFSEKIIGWSFSETENHVDHFNAIKMAVNNTGARPYLFTYDNQSGHKSSKMQELYGKLVAKNGGLHYPNKARAHNSPVEDLFRRLQQQVLNQFWFSDKQSPTVRTANNKPNWDFLKDNKHLFKNKEELIKAWEVCVKLWNDAKHPRFEKTRAEVFEMEAQMREEVSFLDQVELFWIFNNRQNTYKREGLNITVAGFDYQYEVLDNMGQIDIEFRRKYVGAKFIVKYDPDHLNEFIALYKKDVSGNLVFIANAEPKREHESIPVLMQEGDKELWSEDYETRELEYQRDLNEIEKIRQRTGITPERLIQNQELLIKMGGDLPKEQRLGLDSEMVELSVTDRL